MSENPAVTIEEQKETEMEKVVEDRKEKVPERFIDIISGEFAYDPVRLPLEQDPTQVLYNRKTLQTIWETKRHARNPFTRLWFDIKSAIPQTELRNEMMHFIELGRLPGKTVIADYSKILDEKDMERHLKKLRTYFKERPITEKHWVRIWKRVNILRLFCEFDFQNIKTFISLRGFRYLKKVISKTIAENEAKESALDVGKEIVRSIDFIMSALRSRGENLIENLANCGENSMAQHYVILGLLVIVNHVYNNDRGYFIKIRSLILRAFCTIFDEITVDTNIVLRDGSSMRAVQIGYPCAVTILGRQRAIDISSEDLNHGIAILRKVRASLLPVDQVYVRAVRNAVNISISREIERSNLEMSGGQLLEAQMQARHNSESLERGVSLIRDIVMEEGQLEASILGDFLDIVKELLHMFKRFTQTENEEGIRKFPDLFCENCRPTVQCVHYSIAKHGLGISEGISRRGGTVLDVEGLRKFINDRT